MTQYNDAILSYWNSIFAATKAIFRDDKFSLVINPLLQDTRQLQIIEFADGRVQAAVTPQLAHHLRLDEAKEWLPSTFRQHLVDQGLAMHGADFVFYRPPTPNPADPSIAAPSIRQLHGMDRDVFTRFEAEASAQDLDDAYVELDHWAVFGAFDGDRLVCAASMYPWNDAPIADLGVLTLEDARGKGHAQAVVRAISNFARDQGYEPQYRCQTDHQASIRLARASGFHLFGTWEALDSQSAELALGQRES